MLIKATIRFSLLSLLILLPACDQGGYERTTTEPTQDSEEGSGLGYESKGPDWAEMRERIPNVEQREREALDQLSKSLKTWKESRKAEGAEKERMFEEAKRLKREAGDKYDLLQMEAEDIHRKLWKKARGFRDFQEQWDYYTRNRKFQRILMQ